MKATTKKIEINIVGSFWGSGCNKRKERQEK